MMRGNNHQTATEQRFLQVPNGENEMNQGADHQDRGFLLNQRPQKSCFPFHLPHQVGTVLSMLPGTPAVPSPSLMNPLSHENCHLLASSHFAGLLENSWKAPCSDWDALMTHPRLGKVLFDLGNEVPKPLVAQCFVLLVGTNSPFLRITLGSPALLSHMEKLALNQHERHAQKL